MFTKFLPASFGVFFLLLLLMFLAGCGQGDLAPPPDGGEPGGDGVMFRRPAGEEIPQEVQEWVESSKTSFRGQTMEYGDRLYILVTYGTKPTGGYTVEITKIVKENDILKVQVEFSKPGPEDVVTQAITYPYDLVCVDKALARGAAVAFLAYGDEEEINY